MNKRIKFTVKSMLLMMVIVLCISTPVQAKQGKWKKFAKIHQYEAKGMVYDYSYSRDKKEVTILNIDINVGAKNKFKTFRLPSKIKGKKVTKIGGWCNDEYCFQVNVNCDTFIVPNTVKTLHRGCFKGLNAKKVVLPEIGRAHV